ncbi:MAG: histidinol-phosphatase HisJ family protein [Clostridium sp.]
MDYGIKVDWDSGQEIIYRNNEPMANVNYPKYFDKIKQLKTQYQDKIMIKTGLEFGIQQHTINQYETLFAKYPLDFVILSIHQVNNQEFWSQDFQRNKSQEEYNTEYYKEMYEVIKKYKNYSVLGHMDLIIRYDKQGIYPFEKVKPLIEQILTQVINDKKGIEVNTSSYRYGIKGTTPSIEILKLYKQLGGTIITIGSDSHKPEHLGFHIEETKKHTKRFRL